MERQPEVARFKEKLAERLADGLSDIKFFVGDVSESTLEEFCREANAIDSALEAGACEVVDWRSSPKVFSC